MLFSTAFYCIVLYCIVSYRIVLYLHTVNWPKTHVGRIKDTDSGQLSNHLNVDQSHHPTEEQLQEQVQIGKKVSLLPGQDSQSDQESSSDNMSEMEETNL